jgi:hypothetical protein
MRVLGALMFVVGGAGTAYATWASFAHRRPLDVAFGLAAPVALTLAVLGLTLVFVPGFL